MDSDTLGSMGRTQWVTIVHISKHQGLQQHRAPTKSESLVLFSNY